MAGLDPAIHVFAAG